MNFAPVLNVVIPTLLVGYGIYLVFRMIRNRKRGCSCGGCSGCPMADSCRVVRNQKHQKEKDHHEP